MQTAAFGRRSWERIMPVHARSRIQLIGQQQLNPAEGDHSLIATLLKRLPKEVKHTGKITRFVGYDSFMRGRDHLRFFGIEVDAIEDLPDGMIAWDLDDTRWTVWESRDGRKSIAWQEDITWQWLDRSAATSGRRTGEFIATGAAEWCSRGGPEARPFWMFSNVYVDLQQNGFRDDIYLVDYDPLWPAQFEKMAAWLRSRLGPDTALRVEHYGSTAIPGMPAKPVIDILVEVPSFNEAKKRALPCLNEEAWEYWWYAGHMVLFRRKTLMGERTHHVHMMPRGHKFWNGLAFRDYLRSHPEDAARYAALKRQLADRYPKDRERYTSAKTEFVRETTSKALRGSGRSGAGLLGDSA
jgi:GrpB-like predicted nucleotidyltransferase (UPF0157 family)